MSIVVSGNRDWTSIAWLSSSGAHGHLGALTLNSGPSADRFIHVHYYAGHSRRGCIDHTSIELGRATPFSGRLLQSIENASSSLDLVHRGSEHLVGQRYLGRMDGPFALDAQGSTPPGSRGITLRVLEVPERAIDGAKAVGSASHHHSRQSCMPLIA